MRTGALLAAPILILGLMASNACVLTGGCIDPDPDPHIIDVRCDGDVLVTRSNGDGHCETRTSRRDCAEEGNQCIADGANRGYCGRLCALESDCAPATYCDLSQRTVDGRGTCVPRLRETESCEEHAPHCAPGLACKPEVIHRDAGRGDADASGDATPDAATDIVTRWSCQAE
jgi:hypothetical protein